MKKMALKEAEKLDAFDQQNELCGFFGFENQIIWDCYSENCKDLLATKIKLILSDNGSEDKKLKAMIDKIVDSVWDQRKYNGRDLLMVPIFVIVVPKKYPTNADITQANLETNYSLHPVFRIRKCIKENDSENCCMVFVDEAARVYNTWDAYIKNNNLPEGIMIAPKRGVYVTDPGTRKVILEHFRTPSSSTGAKIVGGADISSTVAGLGSSLIVVSSIFAPVVLAPVVAPAVIVGVGCGAYSVVRSSWSLLDKSKHEESISLADPEARGNWIGIAGGAVSMVAGGITKGISYMARSGKEIGMTMRVATNVANFTAMATNGCGVANGVVGVILRRRDGDDISTLDVLQLSSSLFLFTHSVCNFQTANKLIASAQDRTINAARESLSRNQKKAFDKLTKETIRTRGVILGKNDVIRSLNNIPDHNEYFRDIYKINKELNKNNVKVSFTSDGSGTMQLNNGGEGFVPSDIRQNLRQQPSSTVFESAPNTPGITLTNPRQELSLTASNDFIDHGKVKVLILVIGQICKVAYKGDLKKFIYELYDEWTEKSYRVFLEILQSFLTDFENVIQNQLKGGSQIEKILLEVFLALYGNAKEKLNEFLEGLWYNNRQLPMILIQEHFNNFNGGAIDERPNLRILPTYNQEITLRTPTGLIDLAKVNELIEIISTNFTVLSKEDLKNNLLIVLNDMPERAFKVFKQILDLFVREFGNAIQNRLNRVVPYEQMMFEAFVALNEVAEERLRELLEGEWEEDFSFPISVLQEHYRNMRVSADVNTLCKMCSGKFFTS